MQHNIPETRPKFWSHFIENPDIADRVIGDPVKGAVAIEEVRWPDGITCPICSSKNVAAFANNDREGKRRYRCRPCARQFNFRHGTFMSGSKFTADRFIFAVTVVHREGVERARERLNEETAINYVSVDNLIALVVEAFGLEQPEPIKRKPRRLAVAGAAIAILAVVFGAWRFGSQEPEVGSVSWPIGDAPLVEELRYDVGPDRVQTFLVTPNEGFTSKSEWVATHAARVNEINHDHDNDR